MSEAQRTKKQIRAILISILQIVLQILKKIQCWSGVPAGFALQQVLL